MTAADRDVNAYFALLKRDGTMAQVGALEKPLSVHMFSLVFRRRNMPAR